MFMFAVKTNSSINITMKTYYADKFEFKLFEVNVSIMADKSYIIKSLLKFPES